TGLAKNTGYDFFILQVPTAPFGVSWYQGDLESDSIGHANGHFVGRFNVETFAVAPGVAPAPPESSTPRRSRMPARTGLQSDPDVPPGRVVQLPRGRGQ